MQIKPIHRITFGLVLALAFGLLAGTLNAQAGEFLQGPPPSDCQSCHGIVHGSWEEGAHGTAGVDCLVCHGPVPDGHPEEVMPTDVSSRKCGTCHSDTHKEWTTSIHGQEDLTCVRCHNSHTTSLKTDTVQTLCQNCHSDLVHFFSFSSHAYAELMCTDCHLKSVEGDERAGPGDRSHTFAVDLATCTNCHQEDMHDPNHPDPCTPEEQANSEALGLDFPCDPDEIAQAGLGISADQAILGIEPQAVSPVGFAILGTLVGAAAGIILAPWLEKWFLRNQL